MTQPSHHHGPLPHIEADHPALDLLNTVAQANGGTVDSWATDNDVRDWLVRAGWYREGDIPQAAARGLLASARKLRDVVRELVSHKKAGGLIDPAPLNAFLAQGLSHSELVQDGGSLRVERRLRLTRPEQVLSPVSEAAADLLATGDFSLIRKCEDAECTMWFYDRTKSHRRRWCSMAICGNRNKVAAFRRRQQV